MLGPALNVILSFERLGLSWGLVDSHFWKARGVGSSGQSQNQCLLRVTSPQN